MTETEGEAACKLARDNRLVGRRKRRRRGDGELELPWSEFGKEGVWLEPRGAERRRQALAEAALPPPGAETIGVAWRSSMPV